MLNTDKLQVQVRNWAQTNFETPEHPITRTSSALGLVEEAGEVARAVLKQYQGIRGSHAEWDIEIAKELGDVVIKCAELAEICGIDLGLAVASRWGVVRERDINHTPVGGGV